MSTPLIKLPSYHPNQAKIRQELNRFNVLDCGRRFGKDVTLRNYSSEGVIEGLPVAWYEPTFKSLQANWDWFVNTLAPITKTKSERDRTIETITGGTLEMWSLQDRDASRGRHYKRAVINEAAFIPHLEYSWNNVIRITLADLKGEAIISGTPKGRNYFWQLYRRGIDENEKDWTSFKYSTWDNPYIPRSEIQEMKDTLPELIYQQEIMAEFIDDQGSVFRRIQDAACLEALDVPLDKRQYVAAVDVASSIDYTVVTILDVESKEMVYMDRFNRVDYPVLIDRLQAIYDRWKLRSMTIEINSIGKPVFDYMVGKGRTIIPFTTTNASKQSIIQGLQSGFEHGEIKILNDPVLVGELLSFESKRNASGTYSYSAPEGMHDDCVMSLAIAWDAIGNKKRVILFGA